MRTNNNTICRMFHILILSIPCLSAGLNAQENYVRVYTPRDAYRPGTSLNTQNSMVETSYYDTAGRLLQTVQHASSPQRKDLANLIIYDGLGRKGKEWNLLPCEDSDGNYKPVEAFNTSRHAGHNYVDYLYEPSVWNRVTDEIGRNSAGKGIKTEYLFNTESRPELSVWKLQTENCDALDVKGKYPAGSLTCIKKTDENGNAGYTFYDAEQRTLLERCMDGSVAHDTYYVYNNWGQLTMVLPPALIGELRVGASYRTSMHPGFQKYAYLYKYDRQNHCTGKKLPGAEWYYTIYDGDHRPVMEQSGKQRLDGEWTFMKYDGLGRVIMEGVVRARLYDSLIQIYANTIVREEYLGSQGGGKFGYSENTQYMYPAKVTKVYYYDSYDFLSLPLFAEGLSQAPTSEGSEATSLQTGSYIAALEEKGHYELLASYYDHRGRSIRVDRYNSISDTDTRIYNRFNFNDAVTETRSYYYAPNEECSTTISHYYDHANRKGSSYYLITHAPASHHSSSQKWGDLQFYDYDEFGRLSRKILLDRKDTVSMGYDSHSRLESIRSRNFSQQLYYDTSPGIQDAQYYNGQISWMGIQQGGKKYAYKLQYDGLGRLAESKMHFMSQAGHITSATLGYDEYFGYDMMGNLTTFRQEAARNLVNDLWLTYNGNQIQKIEKNSGYTPSFEYAHMACGEYPHDDGFQYDANGNEVKNLASDIYHSGYNDLNLPDSVLFNKSGNTTKMTYLANGRRIRTVHKTYSTGLSYLLDNVQAFSDPINESEEIRDGDLLFKDRMLTRVDIPGGYINIGEPTYNTMTGYYFLTDHLGSIRATCESTSGKVVQELEYMPSGTILRSTETLVALQPKHFCGKEELTMHGYNMYDSGARFHTSRYFRFISIDPLAEKYYSISPYAYCMGNPVKYVDPTGNYVESAWDIFSLVTGVESFVSNVKAGNVGAAIVDGLGVVVDAAAVIIPGVPGGVGVAAKGVRALDKVSDAVKAVDKAADSGRAVEKTVGTSRAARREVMREEGIPTSQQPTSQSKNASGREYSYDVPKDKGGKQTKSVQQQTLDRSHKESPHWEAGRVKKDGDQVQMNNYNRPKLKSDKSKVYY